MYSKLQIPHNHNNAYTKTVKGNNLYHTSHILLLLVHIYYHI